MSEPTDAEKRAHVLGLLKTTVRVVLIMGEHMANLVEGDDQRELAIEVKGLRRFLDEIERGVYRGHVNTDVRAAPGALVPSEDIKAAVLSVPPPASPKPRVLIDPTIAPTVDDYNAHGPFRQLHPFKEGQEKRECAKCGKPPEEHP